MLCNLCNAFYAVQSIQCNLCNAIYAMQSLQRNLCNAINAMRSMQCNLCNTPALWKTLGFTPAAYQNALLASVSGKVRSDKLRELIFDPAGLFVKNDFDSLQSTQGNRCSAIYAMRSMQCNLCNAMQCNAICNCIA